MDETSGRTPDESPPRNGESTEPLNAAEDVTRVLPGEEPTRVLSGETAEETRVMPGAAGAEPPPPPPRPTVVMSRPARKSPGSVWWILLLLFLAAVTVAAIWFFFGFRGEQVVTPTPSPTPTPVAWAGAWARTDGIGGGLVVQGSADAYHVTAYDGALQPSGTVAAVVGNDSRELRFTLPAQFSFGGPAGPLAATLTVGDDLDTATFRVTGADKTSVSMPLQRVPSLTPTVPTTTPTPSASPSPSPTPSEPALRQQMIEAITSIQAGVVAWAAANGDVYPMPADVREGSAVAQYVDPWPVNPYAPDRPMEPGAEPGNYTYEQLGGGQGFKLTGYLDNGAFVVP